MIDELSFSIFTTVFTEALQLHPKPEKTVTGRFVCVFVWDGGCLFMGKEIDGPNIL